MCKTELCPSGGQRGCFKGFCKTCAKQKGYMQPLKARNTSHHKKKCVKKKVKVEKKLKMMAETAGAEKKKCVEQECLNKHRRFAFPLLNTQHHAATELSNDENEENMEDGEDAGKNGERKTNVSRLTAKRHGKCSMLKVSVAAKSEAGDDDEENDKDKYYKGSWSDAVEMTGHHSNWAKGAEKHVQYDNENNTHVDETLEIILLPPSSTAYTYNVLPPLPPPAVHPPLSSVPQASTADHTDRLMCFHAFWTRIKYGVSARTLAQDMPDKLRAWLNNGEAQSLQGDPRCNHYVHELQVFSKQFKNGTAYKTISRDMPDEIRAWIECV